MDRETAQRIRESKNDPRTLEQRLEELRDAAPVEPHPLPVATLPITGDIELLTLTLHELHDLTFNAASNHLRHLHGMKQDKRLHHSGRIAQEAETIARASDYIHTGTDPRA